MRHTTRPAPPPSPLTDAESRTLAFIVRHGLWITTHELKSIRLLAPGDADCLESLLEKKLIESHPSIQAVRITQAGIRRARAINPGSNP